MQQVKPEELQDLGDYLSRHYDLTLEEQDRIHKSIHTGMVKDFKALARLVSGIAEVSLPEVATLIDEITGGFDKSVLSSKRFSDNILSSKSKLEQLLEKTESLESFYKQAYTLQRHSLQTNVLTVEQMKDALKVTTKQINLRRKSADASAKDLSKNEVLLEVLKNAGAISPKGFDFIDDAALGNINKAQKAIGGIRTKLRNNEKEVKKFGKSIKGMEEGLSKYVAQMGVRGRLEKKKEAISQSTAIPDSKKASLIQNIDTKIARAEKEMASSGYSSYSDFRAALDEARDEMGGLLERQDDLNKLLSRATSMYDTQKGKLSETQKTIQRILQDRIRLDSVSSTVNEKSKILLSLMEDITEVNSDQLDFYSKYLKVLERQRKQTGEASSEEYRSFKLRATFLRKANKIHEETQEKIRSQYDSLAEMSSFVPFIGEKLSKGFLDAGNIASKLAEDVYQSFATTFLKTGNGAKAVVAGLKTAFSAPGAILVAGIAAAVLAAKALFKQMHQLSMKMEEVSKNTGLTADQAFTLEKAATRVALRYDNVLSSLQDIRDAQASIVSETGYFFQINNDVLNTVSNTGRAFGYGSKMAGQLHAEFMQIAGGSDVLASNMQLALASISEAHGLAPGLIAKDLLENSETVAKFFTGYPKDLVKASIALNNMGMSMAQLEKVSSHLLDFEKSITAEFEASVAIGRHVNMGKARELLLQGDILGSMQQVGKELGTLAEFDKMTFAQKSVLATSSGMSVKEVRKLMFIQEKMAGEAAGLTTSSLENYELIQKLTGGNEKLFKVQAKNVQASQKFNVAVQKIGIAFRKSLLPLLEAMMPLVQALASGISIVAKVIEGFLMPINYLLRGFAKIANLPIFADRKPKLVAPASYPSNESMSDFSNMSMGPSFSLASVTPSGPSDGGGGEGGAGPVSKASLGGSILKGAGLAIFGTMAYKMATGGFKRGAAGTSILDKIPGIGGIGRGNTPSRPMFVSLVGGSGSVLGNLMGSGVGASKIGGSTFRRGGTKPGAGKFVSSDTVARYRSIYGDAAASARFGPNAAPKVKGASRLSKMTSSVGKSMRTFASNIGGFLKVSGASGKLAGVFSSVSTGVVTFGRNIGGFLKISGASGKLASVFTSVLKGLSIFGSNLGGFLKLATSSGTLKNLFTAIFSGISSITKLFKGKFSTMFKMAAPILGAKAITSAASLGSAGSMMGSSMAKVGSKIAGSSVGKGVGKVGGKIAGKFGLKGLGKLGAKAGTKSILKKIPGISVLSGLLFGAQRAMSGDFLGAIGELTSGVLGTIPGLGTAASMAIDGGLLYRDVKKMRGGGAKGGKDVNVPKGKKGPSGNLAMFAPMAAATAAGLSLSAANKHSSVDTPTNIEQETEPKKKSRFRSIAGDFSTLALGGPVALAAKKIKERRDRRKEQKELRKSRLERIVGDVSKAPLQELDKQKKSRLSRVLGDVATLALGGPMALMMRKRKQRQGVEEGKPKKKSVLGDFAALALGGPMAFAARKTKSVLSGRKLDTSITPTDAQIGSNIAGTSSGGVTPIDKSIGQVNKAASESVAKVEEKAEATITKEDYKQQTGALIKAIHSLSSQIAEMKGTPSIAVIEDSTARDLNRKLKSYNGS